MHKTITYDHTATTALHAVENKALIDVYYYLWYSYIIIILHIYYFSLILVPEKPRNLTYIYEVESGTTIYNATVTINWFLPCNSNGNIRGFNLFINGTPTYEGAEGTFDVVTVSPNIDISDTYYEYPIYNINASYEYTVLVLAVLDDDTEGEVENVTFISPDGCKFNSFTNHRK